MAAGTDPLVRTMVNHARIFQLARSQLRLSDLAHAADQRVNRARNSAPTVAAPALPAIPSRSSALEKRSGSARRSGESGRRALREQTARNAELSCSASAIAANPSGVARMGTTLKGAALMTDPQVPLAQLLQFIGVVARAARRAADIAVRRTCHTLAVLMAALRAATFGTFPGQATSKNSHKALNCASGSASPAHHS